jgi:hypothetical protein
MKNHEIEGIIAPAAPDHPFGKSNKRLFAFTINSLKLGFNSVTVMLVITLALSYTILFTSYPWRELAALDVPLWIMRYAARLPEYIAGPEKKPLVILGSSLIIAPSQQLNDVEEGPVDQEGQREEITKATYYEQEIKRRTGLVLPIENLAIHGAMATDQELITRELIANHKAPKVLIYTVAPRDFIDNVLGADTEDTPTKRVFSFISHSKTFLPRELTLTSLIDCVQGHKRFADVIRRKTARALKEWLCQTSNRPDSLWTAVNGGPAPKGRTESTKQTKNPRKELTRMEICSQSLVDYKRRYCPPNQKRLEEQLQALDALLRQAKAAGIQVILVEMPLTRENLAILQPSQYQQYKAGLRAITTKYDTSLIDFEDVGSHFENAEFFDSAHLNKQGALRFVPLFSKKLIESTAFKTAFGQ